MGDRLTVLEGDCLETLRTLPDGSVHCCVTSPPYWGLRDYGVEGAIGLERVADCQGWATGAPCGECHVCHIVAVFREVRRVLRADGTCWLNYGDCYATGAGKVGNCPGGGEQGERWKGNRGDRPGSPKHTDGAMGPTTQPNRLPQSGLKPKDLVLMPSRVALALQADGWWVRSDIIWAKSNPMPESVTDRPTTSHEPLFLLSKRQSYYYDSFSIREGVPRVIEHSDLGCQPLVLRENIRASAPVVSRVLAPSTIGDDGHRISIAVRYASTILQRTQLKAQECLASLDPEIRQQCLQDANSILVRCAPIVHGAAMGASALLDANVAAEDFLKKLDSLGIALSDADILREDGRSSLGSSSPSVDRDGDRTVAVNDTCEIGQFELGIHDEEYTPNGTTTSCTVKTKAPDGWDTGSGAHGTVHRNGREPGVPAVIQEGRNKRTVWTVATAPFAGAHFATFPPKLIQPCILAGTSERGVCPACGAQWVRVVEKKPNPVGINGGEHREPGRNGALGKRERDLEAERSMGAANSVGWSPGCSCDSGAPVPAVVLDPFGGAFTTALVSLRLGRHAIMCEMNPAYIEIGRRRCDAVLQQGLLDLWVGEPEGEAVDA